MRQRIAYFLISFFLINYAKAQNTEITRSWTSFVQKINTTTDTKVKFQLKGWIKLASNDSVSKAGLWARVDNEDGDTGFFDNMLDRPVTPGSDWKQYTIEGELTKNAKTLNFGGICIGNGNFYFDGFELLIENNTGTLETVPIINGSFEETISFDTAKGWSMGTRNKKRIKVKGYELNASTDTKQGKQSLYIQGTNIPAPPEYKIKVEEGYSPQIGILVSMLDKMKERVIQKVLNMDQFETD